MLLKDLGIENNSTIKFQKRLGIKKTDGIQASRKKKSASTKRRSKIQLQIIFASRAIDEHSGSSSVQSGTVK